MAKDPGFAELSPCFYFCCFKRPSADFADADEIVLSPVPENGKIITEQSLKYGAIEEPAATWSDLADQYSNKEHSCGSVEDAEDMQSTAEDIPQQESLLSLSKRADSVTTAPLSEEEAVLSEFETNLASETVVSSDSGPIDEHNVESENDEVVEAKPGESPDSGDDEVSPGTPMVLPSRDISAPIVTGEETLPADPSAGSDENTATETLTVVTPLSEPYSDPALEQPATEPVKTAIPTIELSEAGPELVPEELTENASPAEDSLQSFKMVSEDSGIVVEKKKVEKKKAKSKIALPSSQSAVFSDGDEPAEELGTGLSLTSSGYALNATSTSSLNSAKKKKFFKFKKLRFKKKKGKKNIIDLEMSRSTPSLTRVSISSDLSSASKYSASVLLASLDDLSDEDIARD